MIQDYDRPFKRRVVTLVPDGGGSSTETLTDTDFQGFIAVLSNFEILQSQQVGVNATAKLFTEETFAATDRILDGIIEYEIVGIPKSEFSNFYDLKKIK